MTVAFWRDAAAVTVVRPSVRIWLFWVVRCMARTSGSEKLPPTVNSSETVLSHPASTICKLYVPAASPSNWKRPRSLVVCVALVGPTVVSLTLTSGRPVAASTTLPLIEYVSADAIAGARNKKAAASKPAATEIRFNNIGSFQDGDYMANAWLPAYINGPRQREGGRVRFPSWYDATGNGLSSDYPCINRIAR